MPSSPDHIRSQRLADVYARAERLRRQRRARLGTGAALLGSLAVFVVALLAGSTLEAPQEVSSADRPAASNTTSTHHLSTTTTTGDLQIEPEPEEGSTTPPEEEFVVDPPPTSLPATSTTVANEPDPGPQAATDVPTCRNSRDPACGPFYLDPTPANEPMVVDVVFSPQNPEPGEEVTFTVRVRDDGPASPSSCINTQRYGEPDDLVSICSASCVPTEPKYGPWDPPPPENANFEETFRHTYTEPGTYSATFSYNIGADCSFSPYRSTGEASVTVVVG